MRLTRLTTAVVEANYDWTIVRAESDEGLVGWGEAFCAPGLPETIRELAPLIEGRDARHVEPLVRRLHLATAHVSGGGTVFHAISGIEAALWDLAARSLEVPLWQLFGGCFRDRVRIYADCHAGEALTSYGATLVARHLPWMGADEPSETDPEEHWAPAEAGDVYTPEAYAARASSMADRGFTALKFDLDLPLLPGEDLYARTISAQQLERQVAIATAAIEAVRGRADVAFDLHWRYSPADALRLARALEGLPVLWLEDPTPPRDLAVRRTHRGADDDADLHGREPLRPPRLRSAHGRRRCGRPRSGHPEGRRAFGDEADRGARRRSLAARRTAQHRGADRHARVGAPLRLDPESARTRVARGLGAVLRRARHTRSARYRGRVCHAARRSRNRRRARPRRRAPLRPSRSSCSSASSRPDRSATPPRSPSPGRSACP